MLDVGSSNFECIGCESFNIVTPPWARKDIIESSTALTRDVSKEAKGMIEMVKNIG